VNPRAKLLESVGDGRATHIRSRDAVPKVEQNLGDSAHADSTDANEMDVLILLKHRVNQSINLLRDLCLCFALPLPQLWRRIWR
jgi:hypothetical protein